MWLIYGYRIKETQEVKYVGQTNNLEYRRYRHEQYDPFNQQIREYNYPLSRGIRKHGTDFYECFIIEENISDENLAIEKEKYWIEKYNTYRNGYNQTPGGIAPKYIKFEKEIIDYAKERIKNGVPFEKISQETGISVPHLSEINTGKRHHDSSEKYPLYSMTQGRKLDLNTINKIIDILKNTNLSQQDIANKFGVTQTTVSRINLGKTYRNNNLSYPIRKK